MGRRPKIVDYLINQTITDTTLTDESGNSAFYYAKSVGGKVE